jgi:hypothetical protein
VLERLERRPYPLVLLRGGARGLQPLLQLPTDPIKHIAHRAFSP